jgi:pSer/pThr/pTyr-binding forkhead associated (FHA) protein
MNAQILCRLKGGAKLTFNIPEKEATIGREAGLAVAVPADGVSRQHAKITWDGVSYWIEDLKSTNGTFVNGADVAREGKERLRHLDVITLGRALDLLFLVRDAPSGATTRQGVVKAALVAEDGETPPYEIGVGDVTLGRSAANNIEVDSSAVSKLHAKIQRTTDNVVLQDMGSSNGTFVNGARVMTALLQDGDRVSLAGVVSYRVEIEIGEITSLPEARSSAKMASPEFSADWKTRYEWDSGEYASVEALRRALAEGSALPEPPTSVMPPVTKDADGPTPKRGLSPVKPPTPWKPSAPAPSAPAAPSPPPAAKPAASAPASPAPKPPAPASAAKPAAPKAPAAPKPPAPARKIARIRLVGPEVDLTVTEPGTYEMGRLSTAALRVVHPTVSRRQVLISLSPDRTAVRVQALGAASPTLVNGRTIGEDWVPLADGDKLQIGEVVLAVRLES